MGEWQPIETCPADTAWCVFYWRWYDGGLSGDIVDTDVYRLDDRFFSIDHGLIEPTHWMPLPPPPVQP